MSLAWETTTEDIIIACRNNEEEISEEKAEEILGNLDTDKIEREALRGDDMLEQTDYAQAEIWDQIFDNDLLY